MSYRIVYHDEEMPAASHIPAWTCLFLCIFVVGAYCFWPEGRLAMQRLIFPQGIEPVMHRLDALAFQVKNGDTLPAAVAALFEQIGSVLE